MGTRVLRPKPPKPPAPDKPTEGAPGAPVEPPEPPVNEEKPIQWSPMIYDIRKDADAAQFGLTPQERDYLLTRCIDGRSGGEVQAIGLHIQDGVTTGSLDWWVHG